VQLSLAFLEADPPAPLPEIWATLDEQERAAIVAVLARLMARSLNRKEEPHE
jgi:hypothetical protein